MLNQRLKNSDQASFKHPPCYSSGCQFLCLTVKAPAVPGRSVEGYAFLFFFCACLQA